jgi:hypothetical protein
MQSCLLCELTASQLQSRLTVSATGPHNRLDLIQSIVPTHYVCNMYMYISHYSQWFIRPSLLTILWPQLSTLQIYKFKVRKVKMLGVILSLITSDMIYKHILRSTFSFKIQFYYIYYNPENLLKIVNVV